MVSISVLIAIRRVVRECQEQQVRQKAKISMLTSQLIEASRVPLGLCATEAIRGLGIPIPNDYVRECFESIDLRGTIRRCGGHK